jgi:Uma2 family endonuclease
VATATTHLTIEDFERLPSEMAEGHELVDGEPIDVSGNNLEHNSMQLSLGAAILQVVRVGRLGTVLTEQEYDFDGNAHGPDISFFGLEKQPLIQRDKRVQRFVPDLAIEIISPNDTCTSLLRKKDRYRRCGTREVWIISPETREVQVYSDHGNQILSEDDELSTPLIPGFQIPVKLLFETL